MSSISSEKLRQKLENKMFHTFVEQHMNRPFVDSKKLDILSLLFHNVALTKEEKYDRMVSIMLVQIALDTHERVTLDNEPLSEELERQLSVLAGDYYSSLYYKVLADLKEVQLIRVIANAIKQINEQKISLYQYELSNWQELMETFMIIEAKLFTNVGKYFNVPPLYLSYIKELLLINRLEQERKRIKNNHFSYIKQYVIRNQMELSGPSIIDSINKEIFAHEKLIEELTCEVALTYQQTSDRTYYHTMLSVVEEG